MNFLYKVPLTPIRKDRSLYVFMSVKPTVNEGECIIVVRGWDYIVDQCHTTKYINRIIYRTDERAKSIIDECTPTMQTAFTRLISTGCKMGQTNVSFDHERMI